MARLAFTMWTPGKLSVIHRVSVGKQYPIIGPPPSTSTSPPPCTPPYTSISPPPSITPLSSIAPPPYTASPSPPEKASISRLFATFKIKDGTNHKGGKIVQKGMHITSGGDVNSQGTLLSDTKKPKPKAVRSGRMLSAGGVRSGGVSTCGGPRFTSMKYAGGWV